jgi:hypothetical protein
MPSPAALATVGPWGLPVRLTCGAQLQMSQSCRQALVRQLMMACLRSNRLRNPWLDAHCYLPARPPARRHLRLVRGRLHARRLPGRGHRQVPAQLCVGMQGGCCSGRAAPLLAWAGLAVRAPPDGPESGGLLCVPAAAWAERALTRCAACAATLLPAGGQEAQEGGRLKWRARARSSWRGAAWGPALCCVWAARSCFKMLSRRCGAACLAADHNWLWLWGGGSG